MAYTKTAWVNNTTPINSTNLNHIEDGIEDVDTRVSDIESGNLDSRITDIEENYVFFDTEETW